MPAESHNYYNWYDASRGDNGFTSDAVPNFYDAHPRAAKEPTLATVKQPDQAAARLWPREELQVLDYQQQDISNGYSYHERGNGFAVTNPWHASEGIADPWHAPDSTADIWQPSFEVNRRGDGRDSYNNSYRTLEAQDIGHRDEWQPQQQEVTTGWDSESTAPAETMPAYAKLGRRGDSDAPAIPYDSQLLFEYSMEPDAGPLPRGHDVRQDDSYPSRNAEDPPLWHIPENSVAIMYNPAVEMGTDRQIFEGGSLYSEDTGRSHRVDNSQPFGDAHRPTAQQQQQLAAGSSYRSVLSSEMEAPRRNYREPPPPPPPKGNGYARIYKNSSSLRDGGTDASSLSPVGSDGLGPPGYRQQYEDNYTNEALSGADRANSKLSLDSHDQDAQWRSPDLSDVVDCLTHSSVTVKTNAAAYLQHLCFNNDGTKAKTRSLGGIRALVELLRGDVPEVQRAACGCLLNLTRGRENDDGKRQLRDCAGIEALARLLRKSPDNDVRELVTGILWNLSSSKVLKRPVIDGALTVLVNTVIIPHSGWDPRRQDDEQPMDVYWSTVFRNASGVLRNVSSDGYYARKKLRECSGLIESLICIVKAAIGKNDIDNKSVENCVCILRNLSYRLMEVDYPDFYDKQTEVPRKSAPLSSSSAAALPLGCFRGASRKGAPSAMVNRSKYQTRTHPGSGHGEQLWQPDVVYAYLPLLADCSNPDTLEAAVGAVQNLAACEWQPSMDLREKVRKEKGLPVIVELLGLEADGVVCAAVVALRNLAIDVRNKELIGKYAIQQLVSKLPPRVPSMREQRFSEQTVCAVIATLQEVIKDNVEHARALVSEGDGIARLMTVAKSQGKYEARTLLCAHQLLATLWKFSDLRTVYTKKKGWKEADFMSKTIHPRSGGDGSQVSLSSGQTRQARAADSVSAYSGDSAVRSISRTPAASAATAAALRTNPGYRDDGIDEPLFGGARRHYIATSDPADNLPMSGNYESQFLGRPRVAAHPVADNYAWLSPRPETVPSSPLPYGQGRSMSPSHVSTLPLDPPPRLRDVNEPLYARVDKKKNQSELRDPRVYNSSYTLDLLSLNEQPDYDRQVAFSENGTQNPAGIDSWV